MLRSLRFQLILWFVLIEIVLIVVSSAIVHRRASRAMLEEMDNEMEGWLHDLEAAIEERGVDGFMEELSQDWLMDFTSDESRFLQINRADGVALHRSPSLSEDTVDIPREWLREAEVGDEHYWFDERDDREIRRARLLTSPIVDHGSRLTPRDLQRSYLIQVGQGTDELRDRQDDIIEYMVALGSALLALSILGALALATIGFRHLTRFSQEVRAITEDSISSRLDERGIPSELVPLAKSFNHTLRRLELAFSRERRFTADASHELRTPVSLLLSTCDVTLQADRSEHDYREALISCGEAAERMRRTVEQLMSLAHLDQGRAALRREQVNLGELVEGVIRLIRPLAQRHRVDLQISVPDEPVHVMGDGERLQEMLTCLVSNAIIHNRAGGRAEIGLSLGDTCEEVTIAVQDNGPGIPAAHLPMIFDRFYRVDKARSRAQGAGGLGLPIAQAIAEAHGGHIACRSRVGEGSTFTVHLSTMSVCAEGE